MASTKKPISLDQPRAQGAVPYVQPGASPQAISHAMAVAGRAGGLPKYSVPVAGGAPPPIPALEQPHREGMTMAQQAESTLGADYQRQVGQAVRQHTASGGIIVPDAPRGAPPQERRGPGPALQLRPTDVLPEEAKKDPQYLQGAGSSLAQSQPYMAQKYGVIRDGRHISPGELADAHPMAGERPVRSQADTLRDLQQALAAPPAQGPRGEEPEDTGMAPPPGIPRTPQEAAAQAAAGPGGAARKIGSPANPRLQGDPEEIQARARDMAENVDNYDYAALQREMMRDVLKNSKQREIVEARLPPLDVGQLILKNTVRQRVPVLPGKFEPTFESMPGEIELKLKQMLVEEAQSIAVTESYLMDKYAVMTTTAGTSHINGIPTPMMRDSTGEFDKELFWKKFNWMLQRNIHMLASLGIHYSWFEERVRKLFVADEGKGG